MIGDHTMAEDIAYLEQHDRNDRGLKLSDKHVSIAFIRPLWSFDLFCLVDHKMANHRLNRKLIRDGELSGEFNYDRWKISVEGKQLLALQRQWREYSTV